MKGRSGWLVGAGLWLASLGIVSGSLLLSLVEGGRPIRNSTSQTFGSPLVPAPETYQIPKRSPSPTLTPSLTPTATLTETPAPTPTCAYPLGWVRTHLQGQILLDELARRYGISVEEILRANCLGEVEYVVETFLYLPPATVTPTQPRSEKPGKPKATTEVNGPKCGPPGHWVVYTVQRGDTLYNIGLRTGATVAELQFANCLGASTTLRVGQRLHVPRLPQGGRSVPTQKPPKPPKPTEPPATSEPAVTPIVVTPKTTEAP